MMSFIAPERWRNTSQLVVCMWLIVPKPSRTKKPSKVITKTVLTLKMNGIYKSFVVSEQ